MNESFCGLSCVCSKALLRPSFRESFEEERDPPCNFFSQTITTVIHCMMDNTQEQITDEFAAEMVRVLI